MNLSDPIARILAEYPAVVLDGAMATELERRGYNLNDTLWSAKLLQEDPQAIYDVHYDYFKAGADCAITCSYQASVEGFSAKGIDAKTAKALIQLSVQLALEARVDFWRELQLDTNHVHINANHLKRPMPFVAASVGPYGAFLADGSEYKGCYGVSNARLREFHAQRIEWLLEAGADLLAFETMSSMPEVHVLAQLLQTHPNAYAWFSFSTKDGTHLCDGTPLEDAVHLLNDLPQVSAVGVNCTATENVLPAIATLKAATDKPILVYPNSGETYDAATKTWHSPACGALDFAELARQWYEAGARLIGGCCRTKPSDIAQVARVLRAGS